MIKIKSEAELKKKCVIFGLEDVLIPGNVEKDLEMKNVFEILENLQKLGEKFPKFRFFAVTGFSADETLKRIEKHCLKEFFPEGRLFFVNQAYLEGREEVDKEIYGKKIRENPEFKDEYFKQVTIQGIAEKFSYKPEEMILVCNDLWTEGYYTMRFSKIEFALIKSAHSSLGQRKLEEIKGLTYINRTWEDIEKLISGKFPTPNYAFLDAFIMNSMKEKLFEGTKLGALNKIARN